MPRGDCSGLDGNGLDDVGIGACYFFWLVGLMAVVLILAVITKFVRVLQIWLRSIHVFCIFPITILMELLSW